MRLRLAAVHRPPFNVLHKDKSGKLEDIGFLKDYLTILKSLRNISYEIIHSKDGYGNQDRNKNWNGMVGMLIRNECDVTQSVVSKTDERQKVIKFSKSLLETPSIIVTSNSRAISGQITDYFYLIDNFIWIFLLLLVLLVFVYDVLRQIVIKETKLKLNLWDLARIVLNQSHFNYRRVTLLVLIFIFSHYILCIWINSVIGSQLIVGSDREVINSLSDLAKAKNVIPSIDIGSAIQPYFEKSQVQENKDIWQRMAKNRNYSIVHYNSQFSDPLKSLIINGKLAPIKPLEDGWLLRIGFCKLNENFKLHFASEDFFTTSLSLGFRKELDPKTTALINRIIDSVVTNGLMIKWLEDMFQSYSRSNYANVKSCTYDSNEQSFTQISSKSMKSLFYMMLVLLAISSLIFLIEYLNQLPVRKLV